MERINDKVRDFVEVRPFKPLVNLLSDPAETLAQYHFTDSTAGLMVQWLNSIGTSENTGSCRAIAGHRGVGKSHFLAVLGAIASNPELRAKITNGHVATGTQALLRRHYPVINVRRGLGETLDAELAAAIEITFHRERFAVGTSFESMLLDAKTRSNGLPLIIIVDTAFDRGGEVRRNDGKKLAEIAVKCASEGIFLGLALDDDIAGADGDNVAISNCFTIDYLEQEHLFNVINSQIFAKSGRKQAELRTIYEHIRNAVPGFRWSEPRFASLYPIHPVIFEIAPFVRRFAPNFSILRFASVSGEKILGRPADSLIGLDELFDEVESELRKNPELKPAFATYDLIRTDLIDKMPARDRLRRKMILKALLLHSLDGRGASSDSLVQSLMLDESTADQDGAGTADLLEAFATAAPSGISVLRTEGTSKFYGVSFGIDEFAAELERRAKDIPDSVISATLLTEVSKLYPEFGLEATDLHGRKSVPVEIEWRGSIRPGALIFGELKTSAEGEQVNPNIEWELYFDVDAGATGSGSETYPARIEWKTDFLRPDEQRSVLFHSVIQNGPDLRTKFGEHYAISAQAYSDAVRSIAQRVAVSDARLVIDGFDYNITEPAKEARNLGSMMSIMLEPIFEARFPQHPHFESLLTSEIMDLFVSTVYGGVLEPTADNAVLARTIGMPLGIVVPDGNSIRRANKDEVSGIACVAQVLEIIGKAPDDVLSFETVSDTMRKAPYGLSHEARMLLLAAMVSNGLVELVTLQGHRINRRSLDLKINWKEIAGIASPRSAKYSKDIVTEWAKVLTADPSIESLESPESRRIVLDSFVEFSNRWDKINSSAASDRCSDYLMSSSIARQSSRVRANYERVIQDVENALLGKIELEECIGNISQAFGDQAEVFITTGESALSLDRYFERFSERETIREYVARACPTGDPEIESTRGELKAAIVSFEADPTDSGNREVGYAFERFRKKYSEMYIAEHMMANETVRNDRDRETILTSTEWQRLSSLMSWEPFREKYFPLMRRLRREIIRPICELDPAIFLDDDPVCACSYRIGDANELVFAKSNFEQGINDGLSRFRDEVSRFKDEMRNELARLSNGAASDSAEVERFLSGSQDVIALSEAQFEILLRILPDTGR